ncbi:hypothetical protein ACPRNU_19130 [Chromobacterium vaccinii]|uniref:hypothetical protein n=1 Tax=Chromobacterium vaccinii TaxID=1108595 RepID=UPI003C7143BD
MELCFVSYMTSSEMASWAQALGVLITVGFAFWHANHMHQKKDKEEKKSILAILNSLDEYINELVSIINEKTADHAPNDNIHKIYQNDIIKGYSTAIRSIPPIKLGSSVAVRNLITLSKHVDLLGKNLEKYIKGIHDSSDRNEPDMLDLPPDQRNKIYNTRFNVLCDNALKQANLAQNAVKVISDELNNS